MNIDTGEIHQIPMEGKGAPYPQQVPPGTYLMLTDDEAASFKAPDITEAERARRLCSIIKGRIKTAQQSGDWATVREFRALLKEAGAKQRGIVTGKVKAV